MFFKPFVYDIKNSFKLFKTLIINSKELSPKYSKANTDILVHKLYKKLSNIDKIDGDRIVFTDDLSIDFNNLMNKNFSCTDKNNYRLSLFFDDETYWISVWNVSYHRNPSIEINLRYECDDDNNIIKTKFNTPKKIYGLLYDLYINEVKFIKSDRYYNDYRYKIDIRGKKSNVYYKVNGGEYYFIKKYSNCYWDDEFLYKFEDWSSIYTYSNDICVLGDNPTFEECNDPRLDFPEHFKKIKRSCK